MGRRRAVRGVLLAAGIAFCAEAFGESFEGNVVGITDGDTLTVLAGREPKKVRIAQIDTPERGRPWAERAKRALSDLVFGRRVRVDVVGVSYKRLVGDVWLDGVCVGCELVKAGHAWAADGYVTDPALYRLEEAARRSRFGLWSLPESAWAQASKPRAGQSDGGLDDNEFTCGAKRYCKEMSSCAEARFYLQRCGLARLDGDGDGVPCDDLCR